MAASTDGSLTLFKNGKSIKTIEHQSTYGVSFINGEIVTAGQNGKLAFFDKELEVLKTFDEKGPGILALDGNDKYIAYGNSNGTVRYFSQADGSAQKVSEIKNFKGGVPHLQNFL